MKVTRFEFFESGQGLLGVKLGLINISMLVKYDVYKRFLEYVEGGLDPKYVCTKVAKEAKCSYTTVYRAVCYFEEDKGIVFQFPERVSAVN